MDMVKSPGPEIPPPPWNRVPRRASADRRDPLNRKAIVAAAIRILDDGGLDGFTMRRVAGALGTGPASLYWHVGSKDGLLDLIFEEVIGEQQVPDADPGRWQEQIKDVARTMRATILHHRDIVRISIGRVPMGPNALRYSDRVLAILRAGGASDRLAVLGHHLLIPIVNGFTVDETGTDGQPSPEPIAAMARDYRASLPPSEFPNLVALADHFAVSDQDLRFEVLIDLFVDGLAFRIALERGSPQAISSHDA
jgi:TetR/AcrR family transcriptional regulator, tetracycline repressor protein